MAEPRASSEKPVKTSLYQSPYEPDGGIEQEVSYVADEILIKYKDTATADDISTFESVQELDKISDSLTGFILYLTVTDPIEMSKALQNNPIIEFIEPNLIRRTTGSEVERTPTALESNLKAGSLIGFAVVLGLLFLLRNK